MAGKVKSIFRQREVEKIYTLNSTLRTQYVVGYYYDYRMDIIKGDVISDKVIGICEVEIPMLEPGDEFYLADIQEIVKIVRRVRSSDGSITYFCADKLISTENTNRSYDKCVSQENIVQDLQDRLDKCKSEFKDYRNKYKYPHRFFNAAL